MSEGNHSTPTLPPLPKLWISRLMKYNSIFFWRIPLSWITEQSTTSQIALNHQWRPKLVTGLFPLNGEMNIRQNSKEEKGQSFFKIGPFLASFWIHFSHCDMWHCDTLYKLWKWLWRIGNRKDSWSISRKKPSTRRRFEPMTSGSWDECSTTVLQLLPKNKGQS